MLVFEGLTDSDIEMTLDELINIFGVTEDIDSSNLASLLAENKIQDCVQEIATSLHLPVRVELIYVPQNFRPGSHGFRTTGLVRQDPVQDDLGIVAQVSIPQDIPMFGTPDLNGFPIRVRVNEHCHAHPDSFIAIMAHELAHVLLACMRHPQKDSELHTDLIPLICGYRRIVKEGRKIVEQVMSGNKITTITTTYGYLSDRQFDYAYRYIGRTLEKRRDAKLRLLRISDYLNGLISSFNRNIRTFNEFLVVVGRRKPRIVRSEHAQRLVQLYSVDFGREWKERVQEAQAISERARSFARALSRYTPVVIKQLEEQESNLKLAVQQMKDIAEELNSDIEILEKYIGLFYKMQRGLRQIFDLITNTGF